jgi:hypothetical protein
MQLAYRLNDSVTALVQKSGFCKFLQLPVGALFYPTVHKPDRNGMVQGQCLGEAVEMFSRDLEACGEPVAEQTAKSDSQAPSRCG